MPRAILFDLDGTLVQTRDSSWRLFQKTNEAFGLGITSQEEYFRLWEGNMFQALRTLCGDERLAGEAARHFLSLLQSEYDPDFVPGMTDVVKAFAGNCSLAVVSSNSMATIRRILTQADIAHCFSHVFAGDVEPDKRSCVRRFLADSSYLVNRDCVPAYREGEQPDDPKESQVVLVTDTVGDVEHALECGIRAVGVAWGMHREDRLRAAGAEFVAVWPQELLAHLQPGGFAASVCDTSAAGDIGSCACPTVPGQTSCDCDINDLQNVNQLRRQRTMAAAARIADGVDHSNSVGRQSSALQLSATQSSSPKKIDERLLKSLARLHGSRQAPPSPSSHRP